MCITLPLPKFAFQYTQEVPAQITKYCQLMNRLCTASEAVNLSQLLLVKKKKKTSKHFYFLSYRIKICFQALRGKFSTRCPTAGMETPWKIILTPNGWQPLEGCPSTMRRSVLWWQICTGTYILSSAHGHPGHFHSHGRSLNPTIPASRDGSRSPCHKRLHSSESQGGEGWRGMTTLKACQALPVPSEKFLLFKTKKEDYLNNHDLVDNEIS